MNTQADFATLDESLDRAMLAAKRLNLSVIVEILKMAALEAQERQALRPEHNSPPRS